MEPKAKRSVLSQILRPLLIVGIIIGALCLYFAITAPDEKTKSHEKMEQIRHDGEKAAQEILNR